jgi:hypothetical protein
MALATDTQLRHSVDLLVSRIDKIESAFFLGTNPADLVNPASIAARLDEADLKLQKQEKEVPGLKACEDIIVKLKPLIFNKKASLQHTVEKVDELLIKKEELNHSVESLAAIERMSGSINSPHFADVELLEKKLVDLNVQIQALKTEATSQTIELDELLDMYEQGIILVSDSCQRWDEALTKMDSKK